MNNLKKTEDDLATKLNEAKTILKHSTSYWDFLNKTKGELICNTQKKN